MLSLVVSKEHLGVIVEDIFHIPVVALRSPVAYVIQA